jgi:glucose-6-phosphate 1-dehydrogenase
MIQKMVLFGATGDLAGRFLLPALAELFDEGKLSAEFTVVGAARNDLTDEEFRKQAAQRLEQHAAKDVSADARKSLLESLRYSRVDLNDPASVAEAVHAAGNGSNNEPVAAYLALPTSVFPAAVAALGKVKLPEGSRIALEKPFGEDLASAMALNEQLAQVAGVNGEHEIFRVDHALGLSTVQNLMGVRLGNRVLEPVWNSNHIEQVQIVWDETLALEGRAAYYDNAGALKDVIQNHLFQILCFIAMEPPISLSEKDLRDRKVDVLRSVRPFTSETVASQTIRARYTAGKLAESEGGRTVPNYTDEKGVNASRKTETFAEIVLRLDNWRWQGTRFLLRSGKALAKKRKEVLVRFRPVPCLPFGENQPQPERNELRIGMRGPDDLSLKLNGWDAGPPAHLAPLELYTKLPAPEIPAYSRVLIDVLSGDCSLSIRGDEAEEAWRVLTPILQAWKEDKVPLLEYQAGSNGPRSIA